MKLFNHRRSWPRRAARKIKDRMWGRQVPAFRAEADETRESVNLPTRRESRRIQSILKDE